MEKVGSNKFFSEFSDISLLKLSAFLHDIGKVRAELKNKKFLNHEIIGAEIVRDRLQNNLLFGKRSLKFVTTIIKNHLTIFRLYYLFKSKDLSNKDLNFFWYKNKDIAVYIFIHTLSDAYGTSEDDEFLEKIREFIIYLQTYYLDVYQKEVVEEPLLSGNEIMDIFKLSPSKKIGYLKEKLIEAQIEGSVRNKEQAVGYLSSLIGEPK